MGSGQGADTLRTGERTLRTPYRHVRTPYGHPTDTYGHEEIATSHPPCGIMRDLEHRTKAQATAAAALLLCISPSSTAASALAAWCRWPLAQQRRAWADTAPRRTDIPRTCTDILRTSYGHPTWTPHGQGSGHPTNRVRTPYGHPTDRGRTPHGQGSRHHGHEGTTPLWQLALLARAAKGLKEGRTQEREH